MQLYISNNNFEKNPIAVEKKLVVCAVCPVALSTQEGFVVPILNSGIMITLLAHICITAGN